MQSVGGSSLDDPVSIRSEILSYYVGFLGTSFDVRVDAKDLLQQAIPVKLSTTQADALTVPVSAAEIKRALWGINGNKAPGPDGYNSFF